MKPEPTEIRAYGYRGASRKSVPDQPASSLSNIAQAADSLSLLLALNQVSARGGRKHRRRGNATMTTMTTCHEAGEKFHAQRPWAPRTSCVCVCVCDSSGTRGCVSTHGAARGLTHHPTSASIMKRNPTIIFSRRHDGDVIGDARDLSEARVGSPSTRSHASDAINGCHVHRRQTTMTMMAYASLSLSSRSEQPQCPVVSSLSGEPRQLQM